MDSDLSSTSETNITEDEDSQQRKYLLYKTQMVEGMKKINQDLLQIEKNMKGLAEKSGPFKVQLASLLGTLPRPNSQYLSMETDLT